MIKWIYYTELYEICIGKVPWHVKEYCIAVGWEHGEDLLNKEYSF